MTEKEAVEQAMSNYLPYPPGSVEYRAAKAAAESVIETAKEHGAKFDHEMVELPELSISGRYESCVIKSRNDKLPNRKQACEVIRRCDVVSKLIAYLTSMGWAGVSCHHLVKWLNGTLPVPEVSPNICSKKDGCSVQASSHDSGWIEDPDGERSFRITSRP